MKLTMYPFKPFEIEKGKVTIFQTGNRKCLVKMINGLKNKTEDITISENYEIMAKEKAMTWIGNPFLDSKPDGLFKAKVEDELLGFIEDEQRKRLFQLDNEIKTIFLNASYSLNIPMAVDFDWDIKKMYKYADLHIVTSVSQSPCDIIMTVLKLYSKFASKKLIVLNEIYDYLDVSQFEELVRYVNDHDLLVLITGFSDQLEKEYFQSCRYYYVDRDFVDWRY